MDPRSRLQLLADRGCAAFPPGDFGPFWSDCVRSVEDTGDRAVLTVGRCCVMLDSFWEGAVSTGDVAEIDQLLGALLPGVLAEPDADSAVALGRHLREELQLLLTRLRA